MRRTQAAALVVIGFVIACDISDSMMGPKPVREMKVSSTVIPPTNNSACNVHWASGVNGSWYDATKWNPAGVPGASSSVCIDAVGTYTVNIDAPIDSVPTNVLAITVGGTGATPTLNYGGEKERVNVGEGVSIATGATLQFTSGQGNTFTSSGTITNAGTLKVAAPCGGCGGATILADIINTGTIQIAGGPKLTLSKVNGAYQNTGNMIFGGFIEIPATAGNATFSQEGGLWSGAANFENLTMKSGIFTLKGGKIRSRQNLLPVLLLDGASLVIESTLIDSVTAGVRSRTDMVPTVTGNVPALMTLWLGGASNGGSGLLELTGNPINYGTIRSSLSLDAFGHITVKGSGRLTNLGTINNTEANRDTLFYDIDITNNGAINALGQSSIGLLKTNGSYINTGVIDLGAGISRLVIRGNGDFRNASPGTLINGAVEVDGSKFHGVGTLNTTLNAFNGGSIAPGDSIGLLTSNQLNIANTGVVDVELSGSTEITQYDRAVATSLAGFSGTLNIIERNGFQSGICGQVFDILHFPSAAAGMFPTINGLNPAPGRMLRAIMVNQTPSAPAKIRLVGFDPNAKVCVGPSTVSLSEGGASIQYSIALRDQPTANVVVKPTADAQLTVVDSAVFTTSNWQTPQLITLSAVDDNVYEGTHSGVVTHAVKSTDLTYNGLAAASVTATIADNETPPPVPTTLAVSLDSASLRVGNTAQASAVVRDQNGNVMAGESVTWSSDTPGFASVSSGGVVTGVAAGSATIRATDGSATGTASVTITAPPPPPPAVTTITVAIDSASLEIPHAAQATAVVRDQYGEVMNGQSVTWSSDNPTFASVSSAGVVTAVAAGNATIRATIGSVFGTAGVTINNPPPPPPVVTTITVAIDSSSLQVPHTAQATATVRDQYGNEMTGQAVTWSSNTLAFASVSNSGVVTAVAEGSAVIKASIGAVFGTASLPITPAPPPPPVVTTVTVAIDSSSLRVGNTAQATATVRDQYDNVMTGQSITWSSDTPSFASVSSLGAVTGVAAGSATIRASVGSVYGTAPLTITAIPPAPPAVTTITVAVDSASLTVGKTAQASATVRDQFGNVMNGQSISWSSDTPLLASVSNTGVIAALAPGLATVRAAVGAVSGINTLTVTPAVSPPAITSITVSIDSALLIVGRSSQATARDQNGTIISNQSILWSTTTPAVVSVSPTGVVTALRMGMGDVTASVANVYGSASVPISLIGPRPPSPTFITVQFDSSTIHVGTSAQATAIVRDQYGNLMNNVAIQWRSTDPNISVSSTGLVTGRKRGTGAVKAIVGGAEGLGVVYVASSDPPVAKLMVLSTPHLFVGDTATAGAFVYNQYAEWMRDEPVEFENLSPDVFDMTPKTCDGFACVLVTAKREGTGYMRATSATLRETSPVIVETTPARTFSGTVKKTGSRTIDFWPGCSWKVWLEDIQMTSDWSKNGEGSVRLTVKQDAQGGKCKQDEWSERLGLNFPGVNTRSPTPLSSDSPLIYEAKFLLNYVNGQAMAGRLVITLKNFPGGLLEFQQWIDLQ